MSVDDGLNVDSTHVAMSVATVDDGTGGAAAVDGDSGVAVGADVEHGSKIRKVAFSLLGTTSLYYFVLKHVVCSLIAYYV